MEVVDILWHVLAVLAVVGGVYHLNRQIGEHAERERLLWTLLLADRQKLPQPRWQNVWSQVLRFCEKDIARKFEVKHLSIVRPTTDAALDPKPFLGPLWALTLSATRNFECFDSHTTTVKLNRQAATLEDVAKALTKAHIAKLFWQEGQWHFDIS